MFQKQIESCRWNETRKASLNISPSVDRPQKIRSASVSDTSTRNWSPVISKTPKDDIIFELPPCVGPDGKLVDTFQAQPESPLMKLSSTPREHPLMAKKSPLSPKKEHEITSDLDTLPVTSSTIIRPDTSNSFKDKPLGAIQPEYYKASANKIHLGSVCFSMIYDGAVESLTVKVIKITKLPPRSSNKDEPSRNSFVRIFMLPDEQNYHQTKTRNKTNNPIFNEEFPFQMINSIKSDKTIRFSVYDVVKSSHILLGHALVNLDDVAFSKPNDEMWRDLDKPARPSEIGTTQYGSIHIALSYNPASGRLGAFIFHVKDLNMLNLDEKAGVCVKLIFHQDDVTKTKKTSTKTSSSCINYNESFAFHVDKSRVDFLSLSVKVVAYESSQVGFRRFSSSVKSTMTGKKKERHVCGHVSFGAGTQLCSEESYHWKEIMKRPGKSVPKWHALHEPSKLRKSVSDDN